MYIYRLTILTLAAIMLLPSTANAHCGGKHGPGHPHCANEPPPPPSECTDVFPGFLYEVEATRKNPSEIRLSSSDGCRTELVAVGASGATFHMTADNSSGVIVWSDEDPQQNGAYSIKRIDFTVSGSGALSVDPAVTILPLAGEEALPGDHLIYDNFDVWGDANHNQLYMAISVYRAFNSGPNAGSELLEALIYDLNDLTGNLSGPAPDVRAIYSQEYGSWQPGGWQDAGDPSTLPDCNNVAHPQYVPTCYYTQTVTFNASGTRLYLGQGLAHYLSSSADEYWHSQMRINIDGMAAGLPPSLWNLSAPELIWAVDQGIGGPEHGRPRPAANRYVQPSNELIIASGETLDTDVCASLYAPFTDGDSGEPQSDIWLNCTASPLIGAPQVGTWESPDSYLIRKRIQQGKGRYDIYRFHYSTAGLAGTEELLIERAVAPDTGL